MYVMLAITAVTTTSRTIAVPRFMSYAFLWEEPPHWAGWGVIPVRRWRISTGDTHQAASAASTEETAAFCSCLRAGRKSM